MKLRNIFAVVAAALTLSVFAVGCGGEESEISETSVGIVNGIIRDNGGAAKCKSVKIEKKIGDNKWRGVAILDNGNEIDVDITKNGDYIKVDMTRGLAQKIVEGLDD